MFSKIFFHNSGFGSGSSKTFFFHPSDSCASSNKLTSTRGPGYKNLTLNPGYKNLTLNRRLLPSKQGTCPTLVV